MELTGMLYDASWLGAGRLHKAGFTNDFTMVLEGRWLDRRGVPELVHAGCARFGPANHALIDRWEPGLRLVTVEWSGPALPAFTSLVCSREVLDAAEHFFRAVIEEGARANDLPSLHRLIEALCAVSVPIERPPPLAVPAAAQRAAEMLNSCLANLHRGPRWVDFTSDRSERQWRRDLSVARDWVGLVGGTFRKTLNVIRIQFAVSLLSIPSISVEEVAARLGYGSAAALRVALRRSRIDLESVRSHEASSLTPEPS